MLKILNLILPAKFISLCIVTVKRLRVESDTGTRSSLGSRWSLEAAGRATSAWEVVAIRPAQRLGSPWSLLLLRRLGPGQPLRVHRLPYIFPKNVHMSKRNASEKNIRHFQAGVFNFYSLALVLSEELRHWEFQLPLKYEIWDIWMSYFLIPFLPFLPINVICYNRHSDHNNKDYGRK